MSTTQHRSMISLVLLTSVIALLGCPAATISADIQTALSDLTQNKALIEQFVRDVKTGVNPADPSYVQVMESYQDARDIYNRYLDSVEAQGARNDDRSLRECSPRDVTNAAADFIGDATQALKPSANTRHIPFQRAVIVPESLKSNLAKIPKRDRRSVTDNFDKQVRWRAWSQIVQ